MRIKLALLATTAMVLTSAAAEAASTHRSYVSVFGGGNFLNDSNDVATAGADTFTLGDDPDTGYVAGVAVGAHLDQFLKGLRLEVEASYRDNQINGDFTTTNNGATGYVGSIDADQSNFAVMANLWWDIDLGMITPYIGGGAGWAQVQADGFLSNTNGDTTSFDTDDSGFAWQLGGGVNFDVSPNIEIGVGYRYFQGPEIDSVIPAPQPGVLAFQDLENKSHTAIVEVRFGL